MLDWYVHDERPHRTRTDIRICVTRVAGICATKVAGLCATKVAGLCVTKVAGICVARVAGNDIRNGRGLRRGTYTARCFAPLLCQ